MRIAHKKTGVRIVIASGLFGVAFMAAAASAQTTPSMEASETTATVSIVAEPVLQNKLSMTTGITGSSREDRFVNSKYVGGIISIEGEASISDYFSSRLGLTFFLTEGSYSNRYGSEGKAPKAMYLDEALVEVRPIEQVAVQAGIVKTRISPFTSTLDANGFPGFKETVKLEGDYLKTSLMAIQAMPTSTTATVKQSESGVTTSFIAYGGEISTNPKGSDGLTLQASLARFEFNNLTSSAAKDSEGLGNSIQSTSQSRFLYGFAGTETGLGASYKFNKDTSLKIGGTFLRNDLAPEQKNKGYVYSASLSFPAFSGSLTTSAGYYYNESDTLPATYTSGTRGFNNRFGQFGSLRHTLKKHNLSSYLRFTRVNEIEDRPTVDDRNSVSIGLEVDYDIL